MDDDQASIEDIELPPDEYARANGLSLDSQVDLSLLFAYFQKQTSQYFPILELDESTDDTSLPQLHIPRLIPPNEQLNISKESLEILRKVALLGREDDQAPRLCNPVDLSRLKLEPPLLRSDPDYDCRELARSIQESRRADIEPRSIPSEPLNNSCGEGLDFPEAAYKYHQRLAKEIQDDKINISKDVLYYLSHALRDDWTQNEFPDGLSYRRTLPDLAITPPLSPLPQDSEYFIPDEQVLEIPVLSDPSTLLETDLHKAEVELLRDDNSPSLLCEPPILSPLGETPTLVQQEPNISSLKIEGPLTPLDCLSSPPKPAVDMSDLAKTVDIDQVLDTQLLASLDGKQRSIEDIAFSDDALAALEEKAKSVKRSIEQEQLQTTDAIARVEIPEMDFSIPGPDWQQIPLDAMSQLLWIKKTHKGFDVSPWPKNSKAEKELRWSPFQSRMGRISMNESIDEDDSVKALLDSLNRLQVSTSVDHVWKQPGFAILREIEEDDEELELSPVHNENEGVKAIARKRKLAPSNTDTSPYNLSDSVSPIDLIKISKATSSILHHYPYDKQDRLPNLLLGCDDTSATSTLLSNYVDFHTSKRQKKSKSSFFPTSARSVVDEAEPKAPSEAVVTSKLEELAAPACTLEQQVAVAAPCPTLESALTQSKIIKALTLQRGIFSRIEKLYTNAEIIERDFDRWNTLAWDRNSISRSPVVSPLAAEADLIVSPVTGIVITTLLKAMQKPLPGHKGLSAVRERIRNVALRYEHLIVLVSEGNRVDETARDLTPSECTGYADFVGFVTGLDADTQTCYVGGGDDTLAKWLISLAMRHAPEAANVQDIIIQDETLWELFLRRAGMNAYAAQAILGQLKCPDDVPESEAGQYGLPAFVRMMPAERVQLFRGLMGGERVLSRVNDVLEARWS